MKAPPSLRRRLLREVLVALGLIWLLGTVVSVALSHFFAQRAFDRSILDDAYFIASGMRLEGGQLQLALTPAEVRTVLFDQGEVMAFEVRTAAGERVAGNRTLPAQPPEDTGYEFSDLRPREGEFRAVALRLETPQPFIVTVAQSTRARTALLRQLLTLSLVLQLLLLAGLAAWLHRRIGQGVAPLAALREAVALRGAGDLSPLSVDAHTRETRDVAAAVNDLLQRLAQGAQAQREFTGNVAHELRTPLAGIRAQAEYGLRQDDPRAWREQLEGIVAAEARASRVLDKLLAVALAAEARTALHLVPVRLDLAAHDAVLRFLPRADKSGVDLGAEGIEAPVTVRGDHTLIEGILDNLIDNALRHGTEGADGPPVVTVAVRQDPDGVRLAVQDNGPGIAAGQREQLLERGVQGDMGSELRRPGGVGLALVRFYARLLGAGLTFGPPLGERGWRVELTFPPA